MEDTTQNHRITRRGMFHVGSAALAGVSAIAVGNAQDTGRKVARSPDHHLPNEADPGPKNARLEAENPNSVWGPETDRGTVSPFKYSFALARKRLTGGGWTRQVTVRDGLIASDVTNPHKLRGDGEPVAGLPLVPGNNKPARPVKVVVAPPEPVLYKLCKPGWAVVVERIPNAQGTRFVCPFCPKSHRVPGPVRGFKKMRRAQWGRLRRVEE